MKINCVQFAVRLILSRITFFRYLIYNFFFGSIWNRGYKYGWLYFQTGVLLRHMKGVTVLYPWELVYSGTSYPVLILM